MFIEAKSAEAEYQCLVAHLQQLPTRSIILESLQFASALIQIAAYEYAREVDANRIVSLILLSDNLESEARRIIKHLDEADS